MMYYPLWLKNKEIQLHQWSCEPNSIDPPMFVSYGLHSWVTGRILEVHDPGSVHHVVKSSSRIQLAHLRLPSSSSAWKTKQHAVKAEQSGATAACGRIQFGLVKNERVRKTTHGNGPTPTKKAALLPTQKCTVSQTGSTFQFSHRDFKRGEKQRKVLVICDAVPGRVLISNLPTLSPLYCFAWGAIELSFSHKDLCKHMGGLKYRTGSAA